MAEDQFAHLPLMERIAARSRALADHAEDLADSMGNSTDPRVVELAATVGLAARRADREGRPNLTCTCGSEWWAQPVTLDGTGHVTGRAFTAACMDCGAPAPVEIEVTRG